MGNSMEWQERARQMKQEIESGLDEIERALREIIKTEQKIISYQKSFYEKAIRKALVVLFCLLIPITVNAQTLTASYYSVESCRREGTSGIMGNGYPLRDDLLVCASWDFPFNSLLRITNINNGKSVIVYVGDRGPAKKLYRQGRTIDLSVRAFQQIADLRDGVMEIQVEQLTRG